MWARNFKLGLLAVSLGFSVVAFAQQVPTTSDQPPSELSSTDNSDFSQTSGAFQSDASKPDENEDANIAPPQVNNQPASAQTTIQWQTYDQPIRNCVQGNTIIPSDGNDVFAFLFNNTAQTDVNMVILGWKKNKCAINFTEGSNAMYCRLDRPSLRQLMETVLNEDEFNRSGSFAQMLTEECNANDPDAQVITAP